MNSPENGAFVPEWDQDGVVQPHAMDRRVVPRSRWLPFVVWLVVVCAVPASAYARTLEITAGSAPIALPDQLVVCGAPPSGWTTDAARTHLRPPADGAGQSTSLLVAASVADCSAKPERVDLHLIDAPPTIDPASVTAFVDGRRLELRGDALEGIRLVWHVDKLSGADACLNVVKDRGRELCSVDLGAKVPADPKRIAVRWSPPSGPTAAVYDKSGALLPDDRFQVPVARVVVTRVLPNAHTVDVAGGEATLVLAHPEAVASVDCAPAQCELSPEGLVVRAVPASSANVQIRLRLLPRVFIAHGEALDAALNESLTVLRCPVALVSGDPPRDLDNLQVLLRLDRTCGKYADQLRWTADGDLADVKRVAALDDGVYVLLWVGRASRDHLTLVATRPDDATVVAVMRAQTRAPPTIRAVVLLPGIGESDFLPTNRDALVMTTSVPAPGRIVPLAIPGVYTVERKADGYHVRGENVSGGWTTLSFGYRVDSVPEAFRAVNYAVLTDSLQRPLREANVPAPVGSTSVTRAPIVELVCGSGRTPASSIPSGTVRHIPFVERDTCRLLIHHRRIPVEDGAQRLDVDITVTSAGGTERSDAKQTQHLVVRHGSAEDLIWIRGVKQQFDTISVHVTHVIDESTLGGSHASLPSAQWTVVTESAHLRFYATAAIPTSLYRFSKDPQDVGSGPLSLNFGVLSRLTWLDSSGHEGLIGLEAGVMGMGLATEKDRQLAIVSGLGIGIPLGNVDQPTQASVNVHAWVAYTVGTRRAQLVDAAGNPTGTVKLNPWAFVFGPSITIGDVGTFL